MQKNREKNKPLPPRKHKPEPEVRERIRGLIEAGGAYPITTTGEKNLSNLFGYQLEEIQVIIRSESRKIMQAAPDPYIRQKCWCSPPEAVCTAYQRCRELVRKEAQNG